MPKRDLLIFTGNCQAQHLAAIFDVSGAFESIFVGRDFGFAPAFEGTLPHIHPPNAFGQLVRQARQNNQQVILAWQTSPMAELDDNMARRVDKVVMFPEARFYTMRPKQFEKRFKTTPKRPERILQFDIRNIELSQQKADFPIDIAKFTKERIRKVSLFHTVSHPTGEFMAQLARGIQIQLGETGQLPRLDAAIERLNHSEGLNVATDHPVSKTVRDAIGADWGENYEKYVQMLQQYGVRNWSAYGESEKEYRRLFSEDSQYWRTFVAYAQNGKHDLGASLEASENYRDRAPGCPAPWYTAAKQDLKLRGLVPYTLGQKTKQRSLSAVFAPYDAFRALEYGFPIPGIEALFKNYKKQEEVKRNKLDIWMTKFLKDCKTRTRNANLFNAIAIEVCLYTRLGDKAEEFAREYLARCLDTASSPLHIVNRMKYVLRVLHLQGKHEEVRALVLKHGVWPISARRRMIEILEELGSTAVSEPELEAAGERVKLEKTLERLSTEPVSR